MNSRERRVRAARSRISDERLIAFFRAIRDDDGAIAVGLINDELDNGKHLDDVFYDGREYGYSLNVKRISESVFSISFGCHPGPDTGDGGEWHVSFNGTEVNSVTGEGSWII